MSQHLSNNVAKLFRNGVSIDASPEGFQPNYNHSYWYNLNVTLGLQVGRLTLSSSVQLAHRLTVELDRTMDPKLKSIDTRNTYSARRFPLEKSLTEAEAKRDRYSIVFGSTYPAEGNFAVCVAQIGQDSFTLLAGFKEDAVTESAHDAGTLLQLGFVATLESVEL